MADPNNGLTLAFTITVGDQEAGTQEFQLDMVTIGSGDAAVLQINDPDLAELHAAVKLADDGSLTLLDLGSDKGTLLNGNSVSVKDNSPVNDGDTIKIGNTTIVFGVAEPEPEETTDEFEAMTPAANPEQAAEEIGEAEDVMEFIQRSGTSESDLSIDRKAPKVLEVAEIWSGMVMGVRHYEADTPAVYIGDRQYQPYSIVSGIVTTVLVLGLIFFMLMHVGQPQPDRYPQGDEKRISKWQDEIADEKAAAAEAKKKKRAEQLEEMEAEADKRIAKKKSKYEREARSRRQKELKRDPESSKSFMNFMKDIRDELIDKIEDERRAKKREEAEKNAPPDPYLDFENAWTEAAKKSFERELRRKRDTPLVPPQFDLIERPDFEDFIAKEMVPIAEKTAAEGKLKKSWTVEFRRFDEEYEKFDDLEEKRVVEDLVLGTRIFRDGDEDRYVLVAGNDPGLVYARTPDSKLITIPNDEEVLLWAPSEEEVKARRALYHKLQTLLYANAQVRHQNRAKCDALANLLEFEEEEANFTYNAQYSQCLSNRSKYDQARNHFNRAIETRPPDYTEDPAAQDYLAALQVRSRVHLRDAWGGDPAKAGPEIIGLEGRLKAEKSHDELRDFILENLRDPGSLKSVDAGTYLLAKEKLKADQQIQVERAMWLALGVIFLLPIGYAFDEIRSRRTGQDFFVSSDSLPQDHFPIVEQEGGDVRVNFTSGSVGFLETEGGRTPTSELVSSGRAQAVGEYHQIVLGATERFVNDINHTIFFIHRVFRAKLLPVPFGKDTDWLFLGVVALLLFLGGVLGVNLLLAPYDPSQEIITVPDRFVELMIQEVEKEKKKKPSGNPDAGEGAKAKDEEGKTGKKEHKLKKAKGSKVAIQKSELDKKIAESAGLLADLNQLTDSSMFGMSGLDNSVSNALGGLIGSQYGNQYGAGGLGSRGSGLGGGGSAAGLGGLGTRGSGMGASGYGRGAGFYGKKGGGAPGVGAGDPIILGALDKSIIDRIVKQHLPQIRYCYQKELNKNPKLFGKLVVKFVIAKDGSVSNATTKASTLKNPIVEKCVNARFMRMRFPKPKGGGIVIVSYPFVFNTQGG